MKTRAEMKAKLEEIESDERLNYPPAHLEVNGPLAIEQITAKSKASALRWCLGLSTRRYHGED